MRTIIITTQASHGASVINRLFRKIQHIPPRAPSNHIDCSGAVNYRVMKWWRERKRDQRVCFFFFFAFIFICCNFTFSFSISLFGWKSEGTEVICLGCILKKNKGKILVLCVQMCVLLWSCKFAFSSVFKLCFSSAWGIQFWLFPPSVTDEFGRWWQPCMYTV